MRPTPSWPLRVAVSVTAAGAGIIHLVMVPSHLGEWAPEGWAFAVAGWLQLALAVVVLIRPTRAVLGVAAACSAVFVAAWAVSRTTGLPFGPESGVAEAAGTVDLACVGLEVAMALAAVTALVRPSFGGDWDHRVLVAASAVPVAVLVLTTAALASPSARDHAHGHDDGATGLAADGHDHSHDAGVTTVGDDKGLALLSNGHHHAIEYHALDPATQAELDRQLAITREVAAQYPTVADAVAAGYRRSGPYTPGLGAHYTRPNAAALNADGVLDDDDLRNPLAIIYTGTDPTDRVAGFMYYSTSKVEPVGFVGTNDVWHTHTNICITNGPDGIDAPFGADHGATKEQCDAVHGSLMASTQWMTHVWSVPGYDDGPESVFAEVNRHLACSDGTYYQRDPDRWVDNLLNTCTSNEAGIQV